MVVTNCSRLVSNILRKAAGPSTEVPSGRTPDGSIGVPASAVRHLPIPSSFRGESQRVH